MTPGTRIFIMLAGCLTAAVLCQLLLAHPGSGIAVDRQGQVYFIDTRSGVWKIDRQGALTRFHSLAYHWMAFDEDGDFSRATFRDLQNPSEDMQRITPDGSAPALMLSSDYPIVKGTDGALYYARVRRGFPLEIVRREPDGSISVRASVPGRADGQPLTWLNGIAAGPNNAVYFSEDNAVRRISARGDLSTMAFPVRPADCTTIPLPGSPAGPYLRGLAVGPEESIYVAASGCRSVLRISRDGKVESILRAEAPWSPTAVAVARGELYVLEYLHTAGDDRREWATRVRKVLRDGTVTTLVPFPR